MKPSIAVEITTRDKTDEGAKAAERRFGAMAKRTQETAKKSGLGVFGKQVETIKKLGSVDFGESLTEGLSRIGEASREANEHVSHLTHGVLSLGGKAPGLLGEVADGAGVMAGALAGTAAAVVGLGVGAYMLGEKWAKTGGEIGRTAQTLGVTTDFLQGARAAGERFGVTADQTTASVDGLAQTLWDAAHGGNNFALGVLGQMNIGLKKTKDGAIDTAQALYDIADAVAAQKDPGAQRALARTFGLEAMLPTLRKGSAALKAEMADNAKSGAQLTPEEVDKADAAEKSTVTLKQHLGAAEKTAGVAAMGLTDAAARKGLGVLADPGRAVAGVWSEIKGGAHDLAVAGSEAGHRLVDGARDAGRAISEAARAAAGSNTAQRAESFFRSLGFTATQAAGMAAGAFAESRLNPNAVNPKSGAFGIGQWLGQRKAELFKRYGPNPSFEDQLSFMGWELLHSEKKAGQAIAGTDTSRDALNAYVEKFMRPAPGAETAGDESRGSRFLAASQKVQVDIALTGAPTGTVARVSGAGGVDTNLKIQHSLDGP
ncbi:MAG: hypothetical protein JSR98_03980 [Proteobacteria bacterium]|nr:hypothetical protein [Pseudomonadota bacterium]